jgi:hypothetical protein
VVPSRKLTVPVALLGVTVAVRVTGSPIDTTVGLATNAVVVEWNTFGPTETMILMSELPRIPFNMPDTWIVKESCPSK